MRLKLDENLGHSAAALLSEAGHDAVTVYAQGLAGARDSGVLEACRAEARCLVTLDLDFANPLVFPPSEYQGIAVMRLARQSTPEILLTTLRTLVEGLRREPILGKLWIVEPGRIRVYEPEGR